MKPLLEDVRDRALLEAICFAVLRSRARSEAALAAWMPRPLARTDNELRALLHVGFAQVVVMGLPAHAALSATVEAGDHTLTFENLPGATDLSSVRVDGKGAFTLDGSATSVKVDIIGKNGETLQTLDLGAREAGQHGFEWPAGSIDPNQVAKFSVRASNGSTPVTDTELQRVRIASVGLTNGAMSIQLGNGRTLAYDQVRGFM